MQKAAIWGVLFFLLHSCAPKPAVRPTEAVPQIELVSCRLAASGELVDVQFRIREKGILDLQPANTYLVEEATGERFYIVRLQRIGPIAGVSEPRTGAVQYLVFKNREGKLRPGSRVTIVIGDAKLEQVVVGE